MSWASAPDADPAAKASLLPILLRTEAMESSEQVMACEAARIADRCPGSDHCCTIGKAMPAFIAVNGAPETVPSGFGFTYFCG